jgi:hypothetical protein
MDLIRLLLMRSAGYDVAEDVNKYSDEERAFHIALLKDAGYVIAVIGHDEHGNINRARTARLTWQGYEFLQLMLDKTIWNRAKEVIIDKGVPWATPLLIHWLKIQACNHIPGLASFLPPEQP